MQEFVQSHLVSTLNPIHEVGLDPQMAEDAGALVQLAFATENPWPKWIQVVGAAPKLQLKVLTHITQHIVITLLHHSYLGWCCLKVYSGVT